MSKSAMLRTRRRDANVKPNRRLDRKSSRGMIYENEELRLRTININAEIERGQSDIKKLRRENEQLRKEIWCLRDEYEKLDKLLKDKENATSCSSCSSDSDSSTSCTESEENETTQNIENVQKTNLHNLRTEFDHLSVVTEETSAENSDKNSTSALSPKAENQWDAIPPDQSYPNSQTLTLSNKNTLPIDQMPKHFFSPIKTSKSFENCTNDSLVASNWNPSETNSSWSHLNHTQPFPNFEQQFNVTSPIVKSPLPMTPLPAPPAFLPHNHTLPKLPSQNTTEFISPKMDLFPCRKTSTDVLVKTDSGCTFANYSQESSSNSFVNGGNLEELLQDIETISQDILQISSQTNDGSINNVNSYENIHLPNLKFDAFEPILENNETTLSENKTAEDKPYKSELNVVLMPKPMPLLGFDKYQNIKSSLESLEALKKSTESIPMLVTPTPDIQEIIIPENVPQSFTPQPFPTDLSNFPEPPKTPTPMPRPELTRQPSNPFFYGSFDSYQNSDAFTNRYNPDLFAHDNYGFKNDVLQQNANKVEEKSNGDLEKQQNEKEQKIEKSENEKNDSKKDNKKETKDDSDKSPKSKKKTGKVSIYFKGKKDKLPRSLSLDTKMAQDHSDQSKTQSYDKSPIAEKKLFDKINAIIPKTSSCESKMSVYETNPNPPTNYKNDTSDKMLNSDNKTSSDSKYSNYDRKHRKSSSTSPERKHVHVKVDEGKKGHKKRHRKSERRLLNRRASLSTDRLRERSFSICTDRSNILDHRFGHSDDYTNSERDRSNSLSSCDTVKSRKMSNLPQFQVSGKIPWFGCWGNGCL